MAAPVSLTIPRDSSDQKLFDRFGRGSLEILELLRKDFKEAVNAVKKYINDILSEEMKYPSVEEVEQLIWFRTEIFCSLRNLNGDNHPFREWADKGRQEKKFRSSKLQKLKK